MAITKGAGEDEDLRSGILAVARHCDANKNLSSVSSTYNS